MATKADGGLRPMFLKHLKRGIQWTPIETGWTRGGVPDAEFFMKANPGVSEGAQGWVEFKKSDGDRVRFRPLQVGWLERRASLGGRCFLVVWLKPRIRGAEALIIWPGRAAGDVARGGIGAARGAAAWTETGGPGDWDWERVRGVLALFP